jgi:hypothetical protein
VSALDSPPQQIGQLAQTVVEFLRRMDYLVSNSKGAVGSDYWLPLTELVAVEEFRRLVPENGLSSAVKASPWARPVMNWPQYLECFNLWSLASPTLTNCVKRIAEFPHLVYVEVEEHPSEIVFNSMSVYEFSDEGKISGLRVASAADSLVIVTA